MRCLGGLTVLVLMISLQVSTVEANVGSNLYENRCGRCHEAYDPMEYSSEQWPGFVREMKARAGLNSETATEMVDFLVENSLASSGASDIQGPEIGGYLYTEYFSSPEKNSNFDLHYLSIHLSGWVGDNISYLGEFEFEHGGKGDNAFVEQAYLDYYLRPELAIRVGAMLTPFNRFDEMHGPLSNLLITRPQISREIGVSAWKDVGVDIHGYTVFNDNVSLSYDLYSINGLGSGSDLRHSRQYRDNNEELSWGGRLNLLLGGALELGGSAYRGPWDDEGTLQLQLLGLHCQYHGPIGDLLAEYARADSENPGNLVDGDISGFFVQLSRQVGQRFRPVIRYGALNYLDPGNLAGRDADKGNKDLAELSLGVGFSPSSQVIFKVEYTINMEGERVTDRDNNQLGLQAAIRF